ncbi:FAD-dependent oxidoreductase [Saccharomonospora cyanea]|uniref:Succinate dehydrogenase/fumarate reductase flavoprotein subunit n=1 Tax=Saccharomonospora cyanea NA-134 TaxID=882082 RepID=H5XHK4_9PSEU|nr:FAD-dependent oxidoreductase [Saccharomonospora cyanea]EHR61684.1 succinate dehydrogenase/fumarate reductase flavoprotein subunit [Saccharomonospora cyanea NA-134]
MTAADQESDFDVIVVGSGAAGLTAALAASTAGAGVAVLEASARLGGTTSVSGGQVWIPRNHHMSELGESDALADARAYCVDHSPHRDPALIDAFLDVAPKAVRGIEQHTPLRFVPMDTPDSFAEHPGGRPRGRNLEVAPVGTGPFTPWEQWTWSPPYPAVLTNAEVAASGMMSGGAPPMDLIGQRMRDSQVTLGVGLVIGLLRGCADAGVRIRRSCRVLDLVRSGGGVTGVVADHDGEQRTLTARRGVVLATGGFEHDDEMSRRLLDLPDPVPCSPPVSNGDGLRMAAAAGAMLGHLSESWCWPVIVGKATWDDDAATPRADIMIAERALPHAIWVNAAGRRFVNEASHNCALAFTETDPATGGPRNLPAYVIGDACYRERYALAGTPPGSALPDGAVSADSLTALAEHVGVDAAALADTVATFNRSVESGVDSQFGRGSHAYDRGLGDPTAPHPNLGTIERPPFFALPVRTGMVGTKGGPSTDGHGRVLDWSGRPIDGLFAAGNAADSVIGPGILSSGMTLGLAVAFGWAAGTTAAAR